MRDNTYEENNPLRPTLPSELDALLDRVNARANDSEDIPEPGTEENPWIGVDRLVNGQKQFHAFSGKERRRLRRIGERDAQNEQDRGQRSYNRQQRKQAFDAGTVRQQLRIITGELEVSPDMKRNLEGHILRQTRLNERAQLELQRRAEAGQRREARLLARSAERVRLGVARHRDLVRMGERDGG